MKNLISFCAIFAISVLTSVAANNMFCRSFIIDKKTPVYSADTGYGYDFTQLKGSTYFSVKVPDGIYRVTVQTNATTVRAESRRLFVHNAAIKKGKMAEFAFMVTKRSPEYVDGKGKTQRVKLKEREVTKLDWDDKLTMEFCGTAPRIKSITVEQVDSVPVVYLCGNSTVTDQEYEPYTSWGQTFPVFLDNGIAVANYAESGETAEGFIQRGRLAHIEQHLKAGDYLFVEFGHNDQKADKRPGNGAYYGFMHQMKYFLDAARKAGATLVLCTPMCRLMYDADGKIKSTHADYPDAIRQMADRENVALVDLQLSTKQMFEAMGEATAVHALTFYPANTYPNQPKELADRTHPNPFGAYEISKLVVQAIIDLHLPLAEHVLPSWTTFSPQQPDDWQQFVWPASPFVEVTKPEGN